MIFLKEFQNNEIKIESYWNVVIGSELPWTYIWRDSYNSYIPGKQQGILFKIMHNCLPTGERLQKYKQRSRGRIIVICKHCQRLETTIHIFADCTPARKIWATYQPIFEKLQHNVPFNIHHTFLTINIALQKGTHYNTKLLLTLKIYILWELWITRNKHKFENTQPNIQRSISRINTRITFLTKTWYEHYKNLNKTEIFLQQFAINNAICGIPQQQLIYFLPR